jgi:hypothetical protein
VPSAALDQSIQVELKILIVLLFDNSGHFLGCQTANVKCCRINLGNRKFEVDAKVEKLVERKKGFNTLRPYFASSVWCAQ